MSATNITDEHKRAFDWILHAVECPHTIALFSCFVDGKPTAAICAVSIDEPDIIIQPLFIAVTPDMVLVDHANVRVSQP